MAKPGIPKANGPSQRIVRVRKIVKGIIRRRATGESITDAQAIESHGDLMPELAVELAKAQVIEAAQRQAANGELINLLHVRCPKCCASVELSDDSNLLHVQCVACHTSFNLVAEHDDIDPVKIGQFEILERLGVGAFSTVWAARDTELDRIIALKIPHKAALKTDETEKLIAEARTTARLKHPHIARMYEVGNDDGRMFLVTELIQGRSLADCVVDRQFSFRESATLCALIAEALEHAHGKNVVHRDLKPSNIMLDESGEPHLTDFGLAKREDVDVTMTAVGKLLGTPAYMAPEQARGKPHMADRRSDIYSLGVILFELLTGERPFRGSTRMIVQQILLEDAVSPRALNNEVPKDLETICLKCLEKDPEHRYSRANEVAEELKRFLRGEPVLARPITRPIRMWRWCQRNPLPACLVVSLLLSLAGGLISTTSFWMRERQAKEAAMAATVDAAMEAELRRRQQYVSDMGRAHSAFQSHDVKRCLGLLDAHRPAANQKDLRGFEWYYLHRLCEENQAAFDLPGGIGPIAFSPDGSQIAIASPTHLSLYDVPTLEIRWRVKAHDDLPSGLEFLDKRKLATCSWDGTVKLWQWNDQDQVVSRVLEEQRKHIFHLAASEDGKWLATNSPMNQVQIWKVDQKRFEFALNGHHPAFVRALAFSPDGRHFASGDRKGNLWLWGLDTRRTVSKKMHAHGGKQVQTIAFSSTGNTMVSGGRDGWVRIWNVDTGKEMTSFRCPSDVFSVTLLPDDRTLAVSVWDGTIRLWDLESNAEVKSISGDLGYAIGLAYSPRGSLLAASGSQLTVKAWDLSEPVLPNTVDGHLLAMPRNAVVYRETGGRIKSLNVERLKPDKIASPVSSTLVLAISPDGNLIATRGTDDMVEIAEIQNGRVRTLSVNHDGPVNWLKFSAEGNLVALGRKMNHTTMHLKVCDFVEDMELFEVQAHHDGPNDPPMAFAPDGQWLAIMHKNVGMTFSVHILDREGYATKILPENPTPFYAMEFSTDGQMLACGDWTGAIKVWNVSTGDLKFAVNGHATPIHSLAISPDMTRLASGSAMGVVKLFDLNTGEQILTLEGPTGDVSALEFSGSGNTLVGSSDTEIKIWRTASK